MSEELTVGDLNLVLDCLQHYKTSIENYDQYLSYDAKREQLARVELVMKKVRALKQELALDAG